MHVDPWFLALDLSAAEPDMTRSVSSGPLPTAWAHMERCGEYERNLIKNIKYIVE